jgi:hypothetical protein
VKVRKLLQRNFAVVPHLFYRLRLVSTLSGLWARDLVAHAMKGCSMKRKSIT